MTAQLERPGAAGNRRANQRVVAFDVGGTRIKAGLVRDGQVVAQRVSGVPAHPDAETILNSLVEIGGELLAKRASDGDGDGDGRATGRGVVTAVGVAVRGIVDTRRGVLRDVNEPLSALIGLSLRDLLAPYFNDAPVVVENDARMYTLGECRYGAGQGERDVVCVTLGTGVGTGVMLDGRLLRGRHGLAGILGGHLTSQAHGPLCSCGAVGCVERFIGAEGLREQARAAAAADPSSRLASLAGESPQALDGERIFACARAGDAAAARVVARFVEILGAALVSLINAYDPAVVIIGGGLSHAASQFLPQLRAYIAAHAWPARLHPIALRPALLGDTAALLGVAMLALGACADNGDIASGRNGCSGAFA